LNQRLKTSKFFLFLAFCLLPLVPLQAQSSANMACRQELARKLNTIIDRPQFKRSHWGIIIQNPRTKETIYSLDSDKSFIPASTVKLLTTAAVLSELGANFRIVTPIYATGELPYLETMRIKGQGDPTLTLEILKNIVQQFKTLGIKSIKKLIIDDSYFARPVINPTWEWGDTYYDYATTVNSVILQQNKVRLTLVPQGSGQPVKLVWSDALAAKQWQVFNQGITAPANTEYSIEIDGILGKPTINIRGKLPIDNRADNWDLAVIDPANYFLATLRHLLSQEGITVSQGLVTTESIQDNNERIITQMYSPPLKKLITETNRESNNLYAEVLLKILAKELKTTDAIAALEKSLTKLGINSDNYSLVDGSGLSRHNLVTPATLIDILTVMSNTPERDLYQTSLSLAGVNGTLKNRWQNTEIQNNLWGKTGNLSGVIALSGSVKIRDRESLVLSILVNNFDGKNQIAQQAIDEIVLLLPQFSDCF
jgi:serine-type D-Ala-D-Ala carboxypeptidase/endopeptidase (penicillin-binding protein 4)